MRPTAGVRTLAVLLAVAGACGDDPAPPPPPWVPFAEVARPEHPRPDLRRDTFVNLNTVWDFAYDPEDVGITEGWAGRDDVWTDRIQVPYAWEAPLSGLVPPHDAPYFAGEALAATTYRGVAWYRLALPEAPPVAAGYDWHLVFGAVDYTARVYVDGQLAGEHEGGYAPFSVNLSALAGDAPPRIVVRVEDLTELADRAQPVGKQGGVWYTRTSGLWQTVYLERRPAVYLESYRVVPEPDAGRIVVRAVLAGGERAEVALVARLDGVEVGRTSGTVTGGDGELPLPLDEVERWDTDHPTLYSLDLTVTGADGAPDVVHGYFGLTTVATGWLPGHGPDDGVAVADQYAALYVNGRPRYLRCVLDQSYYPDGVYTAPSVDRMRADLELARDLGFNCVRLHIKVDEPLKYRLADELGLFVVYDMPTLDIQARNPEGFAGRAKIEAMIRRAIARDANHPSVLAWVLFNENWGLMESGAFLAPTPLAESPSLQEWVREMVAMARALDPTRPVEDNSAGGIVEVFEHVDSDLNSFHQYSDEPGVFRSFLDAQAAAVFPGSAASYVGGGAQDGAPWLNSEVASYSAVGGSSGEAPYCDLFWLLNELRRQPKLVGYVVTQLTDVEYEENGLVTYDRGTRPLCERAGVSLADLGADDVVVFEWLPEATVTAGATVEVPLSVSHWSSPETATRTVALGFGADGERVSAAVDATAFEPTSTTLTITAPATPGPAFLVAELLDADGAVVSKSRLAVTVE
ncbi:MAG: hypothetical protein EP329_21540 [Deltaproteobacteria bacterium]|nr:MAG: hypothetical protein EP329_21540 [Deltaproteobacteria bacterium]